MVLRQIRGPHPVGNASLFRRTRRRCAPKGKPL